MRVERAAREADVGRAIVAEALHEAVVAADHADREAAADRLAVGHDVGLDAEIFLGAARARRKPTKTSSKISTMPRSVQTARSAFSQAA